MTTTSSSILTQGNLNGPHRYGYIPNPSGHRVTDVRHMLARCKLDGSTPPPPLADNRIWLGNVTDQGQTSSCGGHGTAGGIYAALNAARKKLSFFPSPKGIYDVTREVDRAAGLVPGQPLPALQDNGVQPFELVSAIQEWGIVPMQALAPDGRFSDCTPENINSGTPASTLIRAAHFVLRGVYTIDMNQSFDAVKDQMKRVLAGKKFFGFGQFVDSNVEAWTPAQGPLQAPNTNDPNGGGHWTFAHSYDTSSSGELLIDWRNSWSERWGNGGDATGGEQWIAGLTDITVFDVDVLPAPPSA